MPTRKLAIVYTVIPVLLASLANIHVSTTLLSFTNWCERRAFSTITFIQPMFQRYEVKQWKDNRKCGTRKIREEGIEQQNLGW